jgi:hypothetical protein
LHQLVQLTKRDRRLCAGAPYNQTILGQVHTRRLRVGLVVALITVLAGVVLDSILSADWALDDGLLLAAAAGISLALLLMRDRV